MTGGEPRAERGASSLFLFLLPSFIWGTTWLAIKFQLGVVAPEVSVVWRFALAALLLAGWCRLRGIPLRFAPREHLRFVVLGFLLFGANYVLVYKSEQHLTSGLVAVLFAFMVFWNLLGARVATELERLARGVYTRGRDVAAARGIIIADTKFEFGHTGGKTILIDEVLTPDSSRFWPADQYTPGTTQPSFDKQPLRDWLDAERRAGRWNGNAPGPPLPDDVVSATSARYLEAYERLTGSALSPETGA